MENHVDVKRLQYYYGEWIEAGNEVNAPSFPPRYIGGHKGYIKASDLTSDQQHKVSLLAAMDLEHFAFGFNWVTRRGIGTKYEYPDHISFCLEGEPL